LPHTGTDVTVLLLAGFALVGLGALLLSGTRPARRPRS
jgi:LPXTG-motif cell wall-anchored protein